MDDASERGHPHRVTPEIMANVLCDALEGGVTYWAERCELVQPVPEGVQWASDAPAHGGRVRLYADGAWYVLTQRKLVRGIRRAAEHFDVTVRGFAENCDATYADAAVQFALFGELVYG